MSILILPQSSSSPQQGKKHRRRVSFSCMAEVCYLDSSSLTTKVDPDEIIDPSELWYTSHDYKIIRNQYHSAVRRKLNSRGNHRSNADDCDCFRGLERLLDRTEYRIIIRNAVRAVIREQVRHQLDGVDEDSAKLDLAKVYKPHSNHSMMRAQLLGKLDAQEAESALRSRCTSPRSVMEPEIEPNIKVEESTKITNISVSPKECSGKTSTTSQKENKFQQSSSRYNSKRVPFQGNLKKFSKAMTRQRRAWI